MSLQKERDWDQFHSPENLAKSISIEAGELLECFQWNSMMIRNKYIEKKIKRKPSAPEFNSWKNSMQYMRGVLSDNEIPDNTGIAIEYNIPPTGCRIDFMMSGFNKDKSNVVIIELKAMG